MSTATTTKAAAKAATPKAVKAAAPKAAEKAAAPKAAKQPATKPVTPAKAAKQPAAPKAEAPAAKQPKGSRLTIVPEGNKWSFEPKALTLDGITFPATYSVKTPSGDVFVFAAMQGIALRLHIAAGHPLYHGAFDAAMAAKAAKAPKAEAATPAAKQPQVKAPAAYKAKAKASLAKGKAEREAVKAAPAAKQPAAKPATPAKAAKQPKAAAPKAAPAPAAKQPGSEITGKGWRIVFDDAEQRTRVCFTGKPSAKQKAAIEAAGFFWSQRLQSWNKKLTRKAQRAAEALAVQLAALK